MANATYAPASVAAEPLSWQLMSLGWSPVTGALAYWTYRDGTFVGASTAASLRYSDQGLSSSSSYSYAVYAVAAGGLRPCGVVTATTLPATPLYYQTTFEESATVGTALIGGWNKTATDPTKICPTTEKARNAGGKSVKFNFLFSDWVDTSPGRRTMLTQAFPTYIPIGEDAWVGFSIYMDESWEPDLIHNGCIIWQMHGVAPGPAQLTPPVVFVVVEENVEISVNASATGSYDCAITAPARTILTSIPISSLKGRWVDWVVKVKFDYVAGTFDVWQDGVKVTTYAGSTLYRCDGQSEDPAYGPYMTIGPYKGAWGRIPTQVSQLIMYADEIRIGDSSATYADVVPR